jgi:hypothetical protein
MKNIGGSLFASSRPETLTPMASPFGTLQVKPRPEIDTHSLYLNDTVIASHPNGYSCHALAERMLKGDWKKVMEQADYIIRCGGTAEKEIIEKLGLTSV